MIKGSDDDGVGDLAGLDEVGNISNRHLFDDDVFGTIEMGFSHAAGVESQEGIAAVAEEGGVGVYHADMAPFVGFVTCFFAQFTNGRCLSIFPFIHHSPWYFQTNCFCTMPELVNQHYLLFWGEGNDIDPVGCVQHKEVVLLTSARRLAGVLPNREDVIIF